MLSRSLQAACAGLLAAGAAAAPADSPCRDSASAGALGSARPEAKSIAHTRTARGSIMK